MCEEEERLVKPTISLMKFVIRYVAPLFGMFYLGFMILEGTLQGFCLDFGSFLVKSMMPVSNPYTEPARWIITWLAFFGALKALYVACVRIPRLALPLVEKLESRECSMALPGPATKA
jgi:hypothetical protein